MSQSVIDTESGVEGGKERRLRRGPLEYLRGAYIRLLAPLPRELLKITLVRYVLGLVRFVWYVFFLRRLRVYDADTDGVAERTVSHNMMGLSDLSVARALRIIHPLMSIDRVQHNVRDAKLLTIGPRTEGEIFALLGFGFRRRNITALDLISYSPWIEIGNMHHMRFADSTFDVVMLGFVIAYSDDQEAAAREVLRVAKPGAVVAVTVAYVSPEKEAENHRKLGYALNIDKRIRSLAQLRALFKDQVGHVYFAQDAWEGIGNNPGTLMMIFEVRKESSGESPAGVGSW